MKTYVIGLLFGGIAAVGGTVYSAYDGAVNGRSLERTSTCALVSDDAFQYASYDHMFKDIDCYYENGTRTIVGPTCNVSGDAWSSHLEGFTDICEGSRRACSFTCEEDPGTSSESDS